MAKDEATYGFNRADAQELTTLIGGGDREYTEGVVRGSGLRLAVFVSPGGGIPARSGATLGSATCTRYTVAGGTRASTSQTATVYNDFGTAIGASRDIIAGFIDGVWVVMSEDCPA